MDEENFVQSNENENENERRKNGTKKNEGKKERKNTSTALKSRLSESTSRSNILSLEFSFHFLLPIFRASWIEEHPATNTHTQTSKQVPIITDEEKKIYVYAYEYGER